MTNRVGAGGRVPGKRGLAAGRLSEGHDRPLVAVQGLGFVGSAMALAVASSRTSTGEPSFDVVGVDLDNGSGRERVASLNEGELPIESADPKMAEALAEAQAAGNFRATTDAAAYAEASVAIVSVNLDLDRRNGAPYVDFERIRSAVRVLGERLPEGALVILETTVPPGTCAKVIAPELERAALSRDLPPDAFLLAHSYERVMPGPDYFDSIVRYWRVYAGHTPAAADACELFLSQVVDVEAFPLSRLSSTTASEIAKVLENSYRAATIAFMEEWGRFAEAIDVDIFEVVEAVRLRPTHSNIRQPGFGVGGYCLTKDPLFGELGARELFGLDGVEFALSAQAVELNSVMPIVSLDRIAQLLGGLQGKRLLLLGATYRAGVGDTRSTPSELFAREALLRGAELVCHDPLVDDWEGPTEIASELPAPDGFDAVVFAVGHEEYVGMDLGHWIGDARPLVFDANAVLPLEQLRRAAASGCRVWAIGRGSVGV